MLNKKNVIFSMILTILSIIIVMLCYILIIVMYKKANNFDGEGINGDAIGLAVVISLSIFPAILSCIFNFILIIKNGIKLIKFRKSDNVFTFDKIILIVNISLLILIILLYLLIKLGTFNNI